MNNVLKVVGICERCAKQSSTGYVNNVLSKVVRICEQCAKKSGMRYVNNVLSFTLSTK